MFLSTITTLLAQSQTSQVTQTASDTMLFEGSSLILLLFKFGLIISGLFYIIFAVVITRQIYLMRSTLITSIAPVITLLGYLHLLFAIFVFILYLLIL